MNDEPFSTPLSLLSQQVASDTDSTPVVAMMPQQELNNNLHYRPEEDDPIQQESPLLSVLNVVVDFEMISPTPLEPLEFQQYNKTNVKVPVLKVYGPVLRRDSEYCISPKQSACLYIHGAFPYLLARPVVAGPDGSLNPHAFSENGGHVNWDSVESVERIVPDLQANLEAAIQASMITKDESSNGTATTSKNTPVIRNITVVTGRGFYTYCPGPSAPFLRVEYYDPKLRWKVKLLLERGLQVPQSFHPDPLQYQVEEPQQQEQEPLVFHCYEAHIPYTMQFFKDYNLAGMSYIHLGEAKFRHVLPQTVKRRMEIEHDDIPEEALFLESNTPIQYVWNDQLSMESDIAFMQQSSSCSAEEESLNAGAATSQSNSSTVDPFWTRKETSCDVELDVTVDQILNVKSVMTELPQDEEERRKIHWRAVPSLREIWRKERQRMQRLLPPKDDFLSQQQDDAPPSFTLNNKNESTPGARLAVEGMHRLFQPSQGLEEQFRRAMKQIIDRHSSSISRVDDAHRNEWGNDAPKAPSFLTPPVENGVSSQLTPSVSHSSPEMDDAVDALGALASQFADDGEMEDTTYNETYLKNDAAHTMGAFSSQFSGTDAESNNGDILAGTSFTQEPLNSQLSQASSSAASPYHLLSQQCTQDPFEFSQRVERGDCTADDPVAHVEELINPETLTPYDDLEDDDDDNGFLDEEEGMSEREFEHTLSMLATQTTTRTPLAQENNELLEPFESQPEEMSSQPWLHGDITQPQDNVHTGNSQPDDSDTSIHEIGSMVDERSSQHEPSLGNGESVAQANKSPPNILQPYTLSVSPANQSELCSIEGDTILEYKERAPTRLEVSSKCPIEGISSEGLHPLRGVHGVPAWLRHSAEYNNIRRDLVSKGNLVQKWSIPTERATEIEPVSKAPNRGKVKSWSKKQEKKRKRTNDETDAKQSKMRVGTKGRLKAVQAKSSPWGNNDLQIDGNSLKLDAMQPPQRDGTDQLTAGMNGRGQGIEEVEWEPAMSPLDADDVNVFGRERSSESKGGGPASVIMVERSENSSGSHHESGQTVSSSTPQSFSESTPNALDGIGQQGGRIYVEGGGGLKAKARSPPRTVTKANNRDEALNLYGSDLPSPLTMMSIEVHVQCRMGRAGVTDSKEIAMRPNPEKDRIFAVVYVYALDPGGGDALRILERGCLYVPNDEERNKGNTHDAAKRMSSSIPSKTMGMLSKLSVETARDEKHLLLRLASIVHWKDPDMLLSWDTQGAGLGYIIERGSFINGSHTQSEMASSSSSQPSKEIDMVRLLGRSPRAKKSDESNHNAHSRQHNDLDAAFALNGKNEASSTTSNSEKKWKGSGLGTEWDDRVGAGAAASSIKGRLVFSGWKIAAEDVKHPNASYLPAIVSTVLNKRIPFHDDLQLTRWYGYRSGRERWRVLHYRLTQATACLLILDALDVCGRATEAAGLSGVEFSQSFPGIRGSQYKVEGVLLRALQSIDANERGTKRGHQHTKLSDDEKKLGIDQSGSQSSESKSQTQSPWKMRRGSVSNDKNDAIDGVRDNYFFFSPSVQDCGRQEALECQALTLEPQSGHYDDPVVVCDFTALYPSLMIAYNLCYATCAGKLDYHSTRQEMRQEGRTTGRVGPMRYSEARTATVLKDHVKSLAGDEYGDEVGGDNNTNRTKDRAYAAPTGTIFVSEAALRGVLPQVLDEMLKTRAMLKKAAKQYKKLVPDLSPSVLRQLEARQLAIKMISNVTYGYTSATFSGRSAMPLVADSIVECARRTLSNAIELANSWGREADGRWRGAEVIYGDTDSLFIRMRGRSVAEAFEFGKAFCKAVTASNPPPVHLKLEKVYKGSIMQTKKKYCGMKYDSPEQKKPSFEAKGIETIRRDQCALTQNVLRNALITLFQSGIQAVKSYLFRQWSLILSGSLPVSQFILTGRVRSRYRGGRVGPVQAVLARRLAEADPGRVMRHKERLAYVIVATPGRTFRLKDCVLTPTELLEQWDAYSIHTTYYITKHVNAALQRCLGLAPYKVDVNSWFESCPKPRRRIHFWPITRSGSNVMISSYFGSDTCSLCGNKCRANGNSRAVVCSGCQQDGVGAAQLALSRLNKTQAEAQELASVCSTCNLCFEDSTTFAPVKSGRGGMTTGTLSVVARGNFGIMTPLANCTCIDCPNTFERHRLREAELEAVAVCQALELM